MKIFLIGLLVFVIVSATYWWDTTYRPQSSSTTLSVANLLGTGDDQGFARAVQPRPFNFPADHGPHSDFRNEWWYFTGNLQASDGRHFGYQFTIFRSALSPKASIRESAWGTHQMYMGHFAVTDVEQRAFHHAERFSRAALGLAGATAFPFRVWLEDWEVSGLGENGLPMKIDVQANKFAVELNLTSNKPLILQGDNGLSQKGSQLGNASYYYSFTRLQTQGSVTIDNQEYAVTGWSWMDREWSTSVLEDNQVGWDWFALQLSNDWELMFYQLRLKDGSAADTSSGVLVSPQGVAYKISYEQVQLTSLKTWRSPKSQVEYPAEWELKVPSHKLSLMIEPHLADQEMNVSVRYWEGAVSVKGQMGNQSLFGNGYVELTGYP